MSMSIEDLARDRIRQIRTDSEVARQVRRAKAARKAATATDHPVLHGPAWPRTASPATRPPSGPDRRLPQPVGA